MCDRVEKLTVFRHGYPSTDLRRLAGFSPDIVSLFFIRRQDAGFIG